MKVSFLHTVINFLKSQVNKNKSPRRLVNASKAKKFKTCQILIPKYTYKTQNDAIVSIIVTQKIPNMSKDVKTCLKISQRSKHVQTRPNASKHVQTCRYMYKCTKTTHDMFLE